MVQMLGFRLQGTALVFGFGPASTVATAVLLLVVLVAVVVISSLFCRDAELRAHHLRLLEALSRFVLWPRAGRDDRRDEMASVLDRDDAVYPRE
jgi:hypothetical protein